MERTGPRESVADLYVPAFDGVRGLVSLSIALVHVQLAVDWVPENEVLRALRGSWFFSIEFLFLLGGFVAFLPLAHYGRFAGVRSYALRRAGRIFPLYYVTVALAVVFGGALRPVVPVADSYVPHGFEAVLAHVFFLQQELLSVPGFGVQGVLWTISIVAAFYVLFPLVARTYLRWPVVGLVAAIMVSVIWQTSIGGETEAYRQFPLFLADFAIGMTAAHIYVHVRRGKAIGPRAALGLAAGALAGLLVMLYAAGLPVARGERHNGAIYWVEAIPLSIGVPAAFALILVLIPFLPRWAQLPLNNPATRGIGRVSYALFLFHFLVIWTVLGVIDVPRDGTMASALELTALVIPPTLLISWLGTRFIENPLRVRAQRLAARSSRAREPAIDAGAAAA